MANATFTDESVQSPQESLRAQLESAIHALIGIVDVLDPDPDLEDDDPKEDDLEDACAAGDDGNPAPGQRDYSAGDADDAEDDNEDCCIVLDKDGEPSLSSSEDINQEHWRYAGNCDIEADDCDREDDDPLENDDPAECNGDLEATNEDKEGLNDGWYRTEKDMQRVERYLGRPLMRPGYVIVQRGSPYWYPENPSGKRALLKAVQEQANDA